MAGFRKLTILFTSFGTGFSTCFCAGLFWLILSPMALGLEKDGLPETEQHYAIKVALDPETRMLTGLVTIDWDYRGAQSISKIPINLYLNAFSHSETTWWKEEYDELSANEKREAFDELQELHPDPWGYSKILSAEQNGIALDWQAIQPDDGNVLDNTLIELSLKEPVVSGKPLHLEMRFEAKLPVPIARTGGFGDYFFVAQWYPKLAVYEEGLGFVAGQFHAATEFYADFADYRVEITGPKNWTIGATGQQSEKTSQAENEVYLFEQKAVHDFAFVFAKNFIDHVEHYARGNARSDEGSEQGDIEIHYLIEMQHKTQIPRFHAHMQETIALFEKHIGPYPYKSLSVVFPTFAHKETSGMEYPTLITVGPSGEVWDQFPLSEFKALEMIALHEFGHQYFFGLLASNERENAFLDEGINSYWEKRFLALMYGSESSLGKIANRNVDGLLLSKASRNSASQIRESIQKQPSWLFYRGTSGRQIYHRTADTLLTADNLFGEALMDKVFNVYYRDFAFKHPKQNDFLKTLRDEGGEDLFNMVTEAFSQTNLPNYQVARLDSELWESPIGLSDNEHQLIGDLEQAAQTPKRVWAETTDPGWFDSAKQFSSEGSVKISFEKLEQVKPLVAPKTGVIKELRKELKEGIEKEFKEELNIELNPTRYYQSKVRIEGPAWQYLPLEIRFTFSDGSVLNKIWDGRAAWRQYRFINEAKLVTVEIDPDQKISLDYNPADNSASSESNRHFSVEKGTWLAAIIQWINTGVLSWI